MSAHSIRRVAPISGACLAAALLGAVPGPAAAQGLEEVVITAQKREQEMQDVGVSVTALSTEDLRSQGVTSPLSLATAVPAVQFNAAVGNYGAQLTIRGIAQSDYSPHQESPNSMYIDDVYISAPNAQSAKTFDLERVEVLRGPQGTFFGRNSTGGLVNFITAKPTEQPAGYVDLTGGSFDQIRVEAALGGPLSERLRARFSGLVERNDGYAENHFAGAPDLHDTDFWGVRAQLETDITDALQARLSVTRTNDDNREAFYGHVNSYLNPDIGGRADILPPDLDAWGTGPGNDLQGYRSPYQGNEGEIDFVGHLKRELTLPSLRFDWDLGAASFTSLTSFLLMDFDFDESCSGAPQFTCRDPFNQELDQWSQEFRLDGRTERLTWVAGLYGLGIDSDSRGAFSSPFYSGTPFAYDSFNPIRQRVETYALFGQGEWQLAPRWRATLGLRVTRDEKRFSSQTFLREVGDLVGSFEVFDPPLLIYDFSEETVGDAAVREDTEISGKAQLDFIISDDALVYASLSRGVKGAGFNANATGGTPVETTPFQGERVLVYEVGEKVTLLDGRMRVNGAAYYYDYSDFQGYQLTFGATPFVTNNDARFAGAELEIAARPMERLDLRFGAAYLDSKVYGVGTAVGVIDQESSDAPKWTANWMVRYAWPVGAGTVSAQYSGDYIDDKYHSIDNAPAVFVRGSNGHTARLDYARGDWSASVFVNNFTDEIRQANAFDLTAAFGYVLHTYAPPRWWGASIRYAF